MPTFDVLIIGAGIIGTSIAWRLARTRLNVALLERSNDVADGASRANSGIIHSGIHEPAGSETFHHCRFGWEWYQQWSPKLEFPFQSKDSLIIAWDEKEKRNILRALADQQGYLSFEWLDKTRLRQREPSLSPKLMGGVLVKGSGQISPYETVRAILENAQQNGLHVYFQSECLRAERVGGVWTLETPEGRIFSTRTIIISAGAGTNGVAALLGAPQKPVQAISGFYLLLDRRVGGKVGSIVFGFPSAISKGFLLQSTIHGNLMLGPDAVEELPNVSPEEMAIANRRRLCALWNRGIALLPNLSPTDVIRSFSGVRQVGGAGFHIHDDLAHSGIVALHGIKSPGLTAAPSLARKVVQAFEECFGPLPEKAATIDERKSISRIARRQGLGNVVCRCEGIREGEVIEAIRRGCDTLEAVRWATRAGMGRCQGGFCRPRLITTIAQMCNLPVEEVLQKEPGSNLILGGRK